MVNNWDKNKIGQYKNIFLPYPIFLPFIYTSALSGIFYENCNYIKSEFPRLHYTLHKDIKFLHCGNNKRNIEFKTSKKKETMST